MGMLPRRNGFSRSERSQAAVTVPARFARAVLLGVLVAASTMVGSAPARAADETFPRPKVLEPAIAFWRDVFATYSEHQVVVHDDWYLGKVYEVLDFRSWVGEDGRLPLSQVNERKRQIDETKQRVRDILLRIAANGGSADGLGPDERRVHAMFADVRGGDKFRAAADRVRGQSGLRERFALGIARQRGYLDRMVRIFREEGVPTELVRLPLIESCFDVNAYSKVGAAGVWQFMPATGKQYLHISNAVDERRDPLRATRAAARHLSRDHGALGAWPLAITAYNHGRGGIARGVSEVGSSDIGEIVTRYRGKSFGFASRNFYVEFLAALDVVARADELFEDLPRLPAIDGDEIELPHAMGVQHAAALAGVGTDDLVAVNPAFLSAVTEGRMYIPRGYRLRIPPDGDAAQVARATPPPRPATTRVAKKARAKGTQVASASRAKASARSSQKSSSRKKGSAVVVHRVRPGQTLGAIARQYGTTVEAIQDLNKVGTAIQAGQRLRIPT